MELRFTSTEREKINLLANRDNCSPQRWLINLIRLTLVRKPQCGMEELQKLGESNYQLLTIGRNLNQIAKHLNQGSYEPELSKEITQLRKVIHEHTRQVSRTMRGKHRSMEYLLVLKLSFSLKGIQILLREFQ